MFSLSVSGKNNYWLLLVTCGKTWKLCRKMRRPYDESTLSTKLLFWRSLQNFSFLQSPSYKGRKCPCFMEVSLNLSLKRAFSKKKIVFDQAFANF
jgi:hypothetical protein